MNLVDTNRLLTAIAAVDNRRIDDATVTMWTGIIGDLNLEECLEAVRRHFASATAYLMPAHIRALVLVIRDEQRQKHEVLALPSRFEDDDERVQRVKRGIEMCASALSLTRRTETATAEPGEELSPSDIIRNRALERVRRERKANAS